MAPAASRLRGAFDGSAWQTLGGLLASADGTKDYDMTVDLSGRPIVADAQLVMSEMGYRVFSYGWDGAAWQRPAPGIAGAPPPQVYVRTPKIAVDRNGGLVAAWLHASPSVSAIAVARYQP